MVVTPEGAVADRTTRTWLRTSGIAFAVLFVIGWVLMSFTWDDPDNDAKIVEWYADSGNRIRQIAGGYFTALSALAFVVFAERLHRMLAPSRFADLVRSLSSVFAALVMVAVVMIVGASAAVQFPGFPDFENAELLRLVENVGFGTVLLPGLMTAGAMAVATSLSARGSAVLPKWVVVAGYVVGVILIVLGPLYFTLLLLVAWVVVVALAANPERHSVPPRA